MRNESGGVDQPGKPGHWEGNQELTDRPRPKHSIGWWVLMVFLAFAVLSSLVLVTGCEVAFGVSCL